MVLHQLYDRDFFAVKINLIKAENNPNVVSVGINQRFFYHMQHANLCMLLSHLSI